MTKKECAISFLQLAGTGKVDDAFSKFIAQDFIHHNQYFKGDREALKQAMKDAHRERPNKSVDVKFCYEDGDTVITHSLVANQNMDIAVVHIFKFRKDEVIELWDLGQPIDKGSPNENGLF